MQGVLALFQRSLRTLVLMARDDRFWPHMAAVLTRPNDTPLPALDRDVYRVGWTPDGPLFCEDLQPIGTVWPAAGSREVVV